MMTIEIGDDDWGFIAHISGTEVKSEFFMPNKDEFDSRVVACVLDAIERLRWSLREAMKE